MRHIWLIAALAVAPAAQAKDATPSLGVGELSCAKEIAEPLCAKLTERLVTALERQSPHPVVRQAEARKKQRACEQDADCLLRVRVDYERIVSGSVRSADRGAEISLRLLDARRMEKISEGSARAPSLREQELMESVDAAAAELFPSQEPSKPSPP